MTDRPVNRCAYRGCPAIGHWPEGATCPEHRDNPLTDGVGARQPTLSEQWEVDR